MHLDAELVARLVAEQFPQHAGLPVTKVEPGGNDNRTFRIGAELSARLPSAEGYVAAVEKEHRWLPALARRLGVAIPEPVGMGHPGQGYPWPWSLNRWLPGADLIHASNVDRVALARRLGAIVATLTTIPDGPAAGAHSFYRGASLERYDAETRSALRTPAETAVWEAALASEWNGPAGWFHGDLAPGNILVRDGELSALIDWGTSGVGDPACDLVIAWIYFLGEERSEFAAATGLDAGAWARARGWALWKALITGDERVIAELLADPVVG